ncbi:MAG: SPOR domain-containing protein [Methylocella sp.]
MIDLEQFERRLRQPNAANRTDEDPLVELARLVGRHDDPYKAVFEPQPQHEPQNHHAQDHHAVEAWDEVEANDLSAQDRLINGDFAAIEAGLLGARQQQGLPSDEDLSAFRGDDSDHWRYGDDAGLPPTGAGPDDETRSRRPLYLMAAIIIVGIIGIGASFALKGGASGSHEIATIKAASGPAKIQPETTASADVPNQDASILNRSPQPQPVAVADNAEQPVDLSQMPEKAPRVIALGGLKPGAAGVSASPTSAQTQPQGQSDGLSIASLIEPKKVKTISVRPDGTLLPNDRAPQTVASIAPQLPAHAAAAAPIAKAATPKSTARVATTPKPVVAAAPDAAAQSAPAKPTQVAEAAPVAPTQGGGGAFSVQLAAPDSEQEAREIQLKLMKKYGGEIAGFHPAIRKAMNGDKTVYRVRSVGLSKEEATALCQKVQSSGGNCFVAKN